MNSADTKPIVIRKQKDHAEILLILIFLLNTALYIWLMLKDAVPIIGMLVLAFLWVIFWISGRFRSIPSPLDPILIALVCILPVSFYVSIDKALSTPIIMRVLLSIALFYVIINFLRTAPCLELAILLLLALTVVVDLLALFAVDWSGSDFPYLSSVFKHLPRLFPAIPGAEFGEGIHVNTIGGTLTLLIPLLVSLLWDRKPLAGFNNGNYIPPKSIRILYRLFVLLVLILSFVILLMTNSRAAWLGCGVGLIVLAIWKDRRLLLFLPLLLFAFLFLLMKNAIQYIPQLFTLIDIGEDATLPGRLKIWQNAVYLLHDFPLTGVGLGSFGQVFKQYYTFTIFQYGDALIYHPHNNLLSVAVDMGIPGLVLYVALLSSFVTMALRVFRKTRTHIKALVIGLSCGMLAFQVFGIMDAFPLGKKLGIIMWVYLAVMTALFIHRRVLGSISASGLNGSLHIRSDPKLGSKAKIKGLVLGLGVWLLISLIIISLVNLNVYMAIVLSIFAGGFLGFIVTRRFLLQF